MVVPHKGYKSQDKSNRVIGQKITLAEL